jgi:hypothetical protein
MGGPEAVGSGSLVLAGFRVKAHLLREAGVDSKGCSSDISVICVSGTWQDAADALPLCSALIFRCSNLQQLCDICLLETPLLCEEFETLAVEGQVGGCDHDGSVIIVPYALPLKPLTITR